MAKSKAIFKSSWKTGVIYAVVIAIVAAAVIYVGLYQAMPYEMVVYDENDQAISVQFTDDFYDRSMQMRMVSVIFPVVFYLLMYRKYMQLLNEHPEEKEEVKRGKYGKPWVLGLILLVAFMLVWGFVSKMTISLGLGLDSKLFADKVMLGQYRLVYGSAMVLDAALFLVGARFFKPAEIQRA